MKQEDKRLLDARGLPIDPEEEMPPPLGIQHYIDSKVRFAAEDIQKEQNRKWNWLWIVVTIVSLTVGGSLYSIWKSVPPVVRRMFVEPQIRANVDRILQQKTQAYIAGRLDPVERQLKEGSDEIARKTEQADAKLKQVEAIVTRLNAAEQDLAAKTEFVTLVLDAQSDDRVAYDRLRAIARDDKNPFHDRAQRTADAVMAKHSMPFEVSGGSVPWKPSINPSRLSLEEITHGFAETDPWVKHALINYIGQRSDIPRAARLEFFVKVMKEDKSLEAVEAAGRRFAQETHQKIKALATDYLLDWWVKNRDGIVNEISPAPSATLSPIAPQTSPTP